MNQVRADVGLDAVAGGSDLGKLSSDMATLLTGLEDLEERQPDLPDEVKASLADAKNDIHQALQGEEAENIQENLLKVSEGLVEQIIQYEVALQELAQEEQRDQALFQQADQDWQAAVRQLSEDSAFFAQIQAEAEALNPVYAETMYKVAHAEQAVELSEELANNSRNLLNQILKERKKERKARKKYFVNDLINKYVIFLEISAVILDLVGNIYPPAKMVAAIIRGYVIPIVRLIQAAYNEDWDAFKDQLADFAVNMAVEAAAASVGMSPQGVERLKKSANAILEGDWETALLGGSWEEVREDLIV
uniref:hypothetical protein n=1 Tax=Okeania sp. SIO2F4 TaxID=2607790 RepID=UPI002600682C|nr:hypothetical protein [Okeania sp. SIO2F4]